MSALRVERVDGVPIAHVGEDIDAANAAAVHAKLVDTLGPQDNSLIVDLSQTRYLDSAGLDMLLRLGDRLDHRRAALMLVIPESSQLNRLAAIVGLAQVLAIHTTLPAARDAVAQLPTGPPIEPDSLSDTGPISGSEDS